MCDAERTVPCVSVCHHSDSLTRYPQRAKEDASHAAKKAAINVETAADSAKHEAKGFGARLWGKGQVRPL